ncbi:aldehyde dehydrogenase family protein [Roseicyclus sp. F158]|uniref:Aldehyde dehydrogenase family protein n=1 Tax=Tropicimonas omnivorans TaxID=3075590 RepID=A0ABU3DGX0_9RHOB|nr:aldehyde dehydrogenase family protein [Roseicyclus sp. F158]MDT0682961.1 aldehyde dehydrogenase family protein [Roseicyclus sp. F158]
MSIEEMVESYLGDGTLPDLPDRHFIAGDWAAPVNGGRMETFDAGAARPFHVVAAGDAADVDRAVAAAERVQRAWGRTKPSERGAILMRAAALLRQEAARFAFAESLDSGKPLQEAEGDVAGAARAFEYYSGAADKIEGGTFPVGSDHIAYSLPEPMGVTAHIIPWNFPISTAARGIAPALAAGCTVVAKPADTTPLTMLMLAELLVRAGLPTGVCNVVTGTGPDAGAPLVAHPGVRHVTFTGSVPTGIGVMQAAARNVASVVLELGGKSPVIVFEDADLDAAADGVIGAIFENAGQICSAGSRLIVSRAVHGEMVARVVQKAQAIEMGHGLRRPALGPLNSDAHLGRVRSAVESALSRGRRATIGGTVATDPVTNAGWFFAPTIFDDVPADDALVQDEIFGPVLSVQVAEDEAHALQLANCTDYGLVAGIYTADFGRAHRLARDVDAGQVYLNEYFAGGIEVPFGGNRRSGFGREKGFAAVRNYLRIKGVAGRIG